jgi:hypothetical protein
MMVTTLNLTKITQATTNTTHSASCKMAFIPTIDKPQQLPNATTPPLNPLNPKTQTTPHPHILTQNTLNYPITAKKQPN